MSIDTQKLSEAIVTTKRMLRSQLPGYAKAFTEVEDHIKHELDEVQELRVRGKSVIPEIDYSDIATTRVRADRVQAVKRRGAAVVRRVFSYQQADAWNEELADYIIRNGYY